jgi:glutamate---cysteine ligase / carboxylate-amine ligase
MLGRGADGPYTRLVEHAFGSSPLTVGVEEELLLVADAPPHDLEHFVGELVARIGSPDVKPDVYEATVEGSSPVCATATGAARELERLREAMRAAGATLAGAGLHPAARYGEVVHVRHPRYDRIHGTMRGLLERTPTCALHVHVGMPDPDTAIAAFNRLRSHLPLLQALAANSPFWHGRDSGFATARAQLFRGFPRAVIPRPFANWDDYY